MSGTDRKFRVRGESGRSSEETLLEEAAEEVIRSYFLFTPSNPVMSVLFLHSHCDVFYLQQMMIHTYIVWRPRLTPSGSEHFPTCGAGTFSSFWRCVTFPTNHLLTSSVYTNSYMTFIRDGGGGYAYLPTVPDLEGLSLIHNKVPLSSSCVPHVGLIYIHVYKMHYLSIKKSFPVLNLPSNFYIFLLHL